MKSKKILLFLPNLKPGTGGFASAVELLDTISISGNEACLVLTNYDPSYHRRYRQFISQNPKIKFQFQYVPGYFELLQSYGNKSSLKVLFLDNLINLLTKPTKRQLKTLVNSIVGIFNKHNLNIFDGIVMQADIIIKSMTMSGFELSLIRKRYNAIIIQNHAGSPHAYENYWLTEDQMPLNSDPSLSLYVNFCLAFDKILFQAQDQAMECAQRHPALSSKVITINPTCDEEKIIAAKEDKNPYNSEFVNLINVGTIQPRKAQHLTIESFQFILKSHPKTRLHFVGGWERPYRDYVKELKRQIFELNMSENIFIHGHRDDYLRFMAHADILIQTSDAEGVSRVLREAMLIKLPIISYSISGTNKILEHQKEALLTKPKDTKAMANAILDLLINSEKRLAIADAAYKRYQLYHSKTIFTKNIKNMIEEITT